MRAPPTSIRQSPCAIPFLPCWRALEINPCGVFWAEKSMCCGYFSDVHGWEVVTSLCSAPFSGYMLLISTLNGDYRWIFGFNWIRGGARLQEATESLLAECLMKDWNELWLWQVQYGDFHAYWRVTSVHRCRWEQAKTKAKSSLP
jgi:hypothetical protein